ncbi:MAG: hypothetical protein IIX39_00370 [Clostridia bacterium]|nr:hypothetical protein [Clostridia bacterium]
MLKTTKENCIIIQADEGKVLYSDDFKNVKIANVPVDYDLSKIYEADEIKDDEEEEVEE